MINLVFVWKSSSVISVNVHVWMQLQQALIPARRLDFQLCCSSHLSSWKLAIPLQKSHVCMQVFSGFTKTLSAGHKVTGTARNFLRNTAYTWIWAPGYSVSHSTTPFKIIIWLDFWPVPHDNFLHQFNLAKGVSKLAFSQPDNKTMTTAKEVLWFS